LNEIDPAMDSPNGSTILVTGAAGFLGWYLVTKLKQMRRRVVATDLLAGSEIVPSFIGRSLVPKPAAGRTAFLIMSLST